MFFKQSVRSCIEAFPSFGNNLPLWPLLSMEMVWAVMETETGFCFYTLLSLCQCYGYLRNAESPVSASRDAAGDDHNH